MLHLAVGCESSPGNVRYRLSQAWRGRRWFYLPISIRFLGITLGAELLNSGSLHRRSFPKRWLYGTGVICKDRWLVAIHLLQDIRCDEGQTLNYHEEMFLYLIAGNPLASPFISPRKLAIMKALEWCCAWVTRSVAVGCAGWSFAHGRGDWELRSASGARNVSLSLWEMYWFFGLAAVSRCPGLSA